MQVYYQTEEIELQCWGAIERGMWMNVGVTAGGGQSRAVRTGERKAESGGWRVEGGGRRRESLEEGSRGESREEGRSVWG